MGVEITLWHSGFNSFGYRSKVELLDHEYICIYIYIYVFVYIYI